MHRRPLALAAASSAVALASTVMPHTPTGADTPQVDPLDAALDQALAAHPAPVGSVETVTVDPADGTTSIELSGGAIAEIELPFDDAEPSATPVDAHSATFRDEASDTTAVVQPLVTNGVRMILTMGSADSPTRYEFDLGDSSKLVDLSMAPNGGAVAPACLLVEAPHAIVFAVAAGRYYEDGDCLKIRFNPVTLSASPQRLDHGTYNCTDK